MAQTIVLKTSQISAAPGLQVLRRDPMLTGDNGGVKIMVDLSWLWSWPGGAPLDGSVVKDIAEVGDGSAQIAAGQAVAYVGGGFDFTGLTADPACVRGPVGCLSSIWGGANQYFMVVGWSKMPLIGDWFSAANEAPIFSTVVGAGDFGGEADLLTISQKAAPSFSATRQKNTGFSADILSITALANFYGQVTQWAYWRNAAGQGLRMKSALGTQAVTMATGANNVVNFSACRPQWGVPATINNLAASAQYRAAAKHRFYRGWVEDLLVSGRDPVAALDADYAFCTQQGAFS